MKIQDIKPGDKVELNDKGTMFVDPATGFAITGEETAVLKAPIGKMTGQAIVSGGLLVVGGKRMLGAGDGDDAAEKPAGLMRGRAKKAAATEGK